jgi:excisionase family DNA binding protein
MTKGRNLRVDEVAEMTGYKPSTIRKKLLRREIGFHKVGRIIVIPESEVDRLLGEFRKPI